MEKVIVNTVPSYEVIVDRGLIDKVGEYVRGLNKGEQAVVVTDSNVNILYAERVRVSLEKAGYQTSVFVFPAGESSKSHSVLCALYAFMAEKAVSRSDILIALGGGVTGDLTGFAAASYLRGIDFVQVPTTLLAQVDSSVGGKTGVNIAEGKNLVGAFKQPIIVLCDVDTLNTLSDEIFADGMGEVIKHGMIKSKALFELIESGDVKTNIQNIVKQNIEIKAQVVANDEKEQGERMLLNFGHTLGHAIEKYYQYRGLSHGQAVAIGMVLMTTYAEKHGLTEKGLTDRLKKCLENNKLPTTTDISLDELYTLSLNDKKRLSGGINIIICSEVGTSFAKKMDIVDYKAFLDL